MKQKKLLCLLFFLLLQNGIWAELPGHGAYVAQEEVLLSEISKGDIMQLPPLIQATTLEGDYKAMADLGLAFTSLSSQEDPGQAYENILCSCVRVQVDGHYGSGSIFRLLENEMIIVTNRHVLQYWNEDSYVTFFNGAVVGGTPIGVSKEADVGFVSIPVASFTYEELLGYRNVRVPVKAVTGKEADTCIEVLSEGSGIFFVDMATDWTDPMRIDGSVIAPLIYLEDFQTEMFYGKGEAIPGMSGCGVFDDYGNYVGMMTGGTLQGEIAAVPVQVIIVEYEKIVGSKFG